ncbi:DNA primase [Salinimicrobium catena]|uniref:DNA primase n=1 Tax=Salinimicrobium catena TaxID=390640 RepID=A0A1H5NZV2_9FLAO|nr:DNA primase [Salinimicrobium catena]SDL63598.1 DNA primase [Salinimicrobium catena]SEF07115.1 DNA primase [Salinimicrobium catena]
MISKNTIDRVFEAARVEEVLGDFVNLKKSGSNFKGLSPFSDERTPSFMVSPVKQIWKDFSSGKGGNVVAFLMEHEHFTYPEAIKYLAKKYNIEVEETEQSQEQKEQADERESMYLVSEFAAKYFRDTLLRTELGKAIGLSYFKERGFTDETIEKFGLGYCLDEWDAFTSEAIRKGYKLEFLEKTGLSIVKGEKQFDRFKGRVMFPIQSMSGRVLGFGGRILTSDKKAAKYLNSPESSIYHKSKVLYGIYHAKQAIAKEDNCFLVEGYTDVIQFNQAGIENVVSSSGTALTPEQIRLINRLTKNITVLFDSDAAGQRASLRGIDLILEQGMNVKVCAFPDGEDPDSFAKKHSEEDIRLYLKNNSKDFIEYKASLLMEEAQNDPVKKASLIRDMVGSISKIPDHIQQEIYVQETSRIMDISEEVIFSTLAQMAGGAAKKSAPKKTKSFEVVREDGAPRTKVDELYVLERKIISLLLLYGPMEDEFEDMVLKINDKGEMELEPEIQKARVFEKVFLDLQEDEVAFANENFRKIYQQVISKFQEEEQFSLETFINEMPAENSSEVTNILMEEEQYVLHDWERMEIFVKDKKAGIGRLVNETILSLRRYLVNQKINELNQEVKQAPAERAQEILQDIMDYLSLKRVLSNKLNRVM